MVSKCGSQLSQKSCAEAQQTKADASTLPEERVWAWVETIRNVFVRDFASVAGAAGASVGTSEAEAASQRAAAPEKQHRPQSCDRPNASATHARLAPRVAGPTQTGVGGSVR
eukprot:5576051-Alexandrium_andersonii.AAC.1